jgi:nitric oxide reductase large subunit
VEAPLYGRYAAESWMVGCLYLGNSDIHGKGIFTDAPIQRGTVVIKWGGVVFTEDDLRAGKARQHSYVGIGIGLYLANPQDKASRVRRLYEPLLRWERLDG